MKQHITILALFAITILFQECKKEPAEASNLINHNSFFDSTVKFLKSRLSQDKLQQLDFTRSKVLVYKNQNRGIQIFEKNSNNKFLLLENNTAGYSGNWVDLSGLKKTSLHLNNGAITLENLDNTFFTELVIEDNKLIEMDKTNKTTNSVSGVVKTYFKNETNNISLLETESPVLPTVIIYYDVYGNSDGGIDYYSWYWLFDQIPSYSYDYFPTGGGGGGSAGSNSSNIAVAPEFISPNVPITDLNKELKCFTNNNTSTYTISVNVNQPFPESRDIINALSEFPVGHTFLTLEQHNTDGSSVIRNVGFYPKNSVKPGSEIDQSIFGDDSSTPFDVTLNFPVTGTEMNKVIGKLLDQRSLQYDLDNFNCTNSSMQVLKSISINLPDTKSDDPLFNGNDPADLGEDIRNLNLNTFSSQNGNRKITRTLSNSDNQYPKEKNGTCP